MSRPFMIGAAVFTMTVLSPVEAQQWQVCNKTAYTVSVAVGYAVPNGRLVSEGWFTLGPCNGCSVVALPEETVDRSTGYLWAKARKGPVLIEGSEPLCVKMSGNFKIRGGQDCKARNFESRSFRRLGIDMTKDFTTNIRGTKECNQ
jgi:uncharacterized membrane protein